MASVLPSPAARTASSRISASTATYFFLPTVSPATICARAAARAPACAATLPPPGVGEGEATEPTNSLTDSPPLMAVRTFRSSTMSGEKLRSRTWRAAASNSTRSGTRPTSSLHVGVTPRASASIRTMSYAWCSGVFSVSTRFIETCAWPSTSKPSPFTYFRPPAEPRTALATSLATGMLDAGPSRRMHGRGAEVRSPLGRGADLGSNSLELATADVGQVFAIRPRGGALVEEDGDAELSADALAEGARERDAVFHRRPFERNEGHDVGRAHPGMFAGVRREVDALLRLADAGEGGIGHDIDGRDEGDDAPVVAGVGAGIEDVRAGRRTSGERRLL